MTTPPSLGGVTQIPVSINPTQALPSLGGGVVTLYNSDLTNLAYVSYTRWFTPGAPNSIPIQPLSNATLDASKAIYVAGLVANQAPLFVAPGGTQLQPSPAQIAAQINALGLMKDTTGQTLVTTTGGTTSAVNSLPTSGLSTDTHLTAVTGPLARDTSVNALPTGIAGTGAPLLILNSNLQNSNNQVLAAAGSVQSATLVLTQPSYQAVFTAIDNVAGTQHRTVEISLTWSDSTTGKTVQQDTFYMLPGASGGTAHTVVGDGPSKGDRCIITITNHDTAAITYSLSFTQNSKVFTRDLWRSLNMVIATGFLAGGGNVPGMAILDANPTIANGASQTRLMPLWTGQISASFVPGSGANGNVVFQIWSEDPNTSNWQRPYTFSVASGNVANNTSLILPNAQCYLTIINNGTASAIMGAYMTAFEQ